MSNYPDEFNNMIECDFDEMSETDMSSVASNIKKQRKLLDDLNKTDKGYNKIYRKVNMVRVPIKFYTTAYTPGARIRHAVSGIREPDLFVGKTDEDLFFKVVLATGELGRTAFSTQMFFYSPEEYERHFYCMVSQDVKKKWMDKYIVEKIRRDKLSEERYHLLNEYVIVK